MKKILILELYIIFFLISYPLLFSMLSDKETLTYKKENITIHITHAGIYTQWSLLKNEKLFSIISAIRLRITPDNSVYYIIDRAGIINGKLKHTLKYDKELSEQFGELNPYVIVSYGENSAKTISFDDKKNHFKLSKENI